MLHPALYDLIVNGGVSEVLYDEALPPRSSVDVPLAVRLTPGSSEFHLGDGQWADGSPTSGLLREIIGLQFEARAGKGRPFTARALLERVMRKMLTLRGGQVNLPANLADPPFDTWKATYGVPPEQRTLYRCNLVSPPYFLERDNEERAIYALTMELWHSPLRASE